MWNLGLFGTGDCQYNISARKQGMHACFKAISFEPLLSTLFSDAGELALGVTYNYAIRGTQVHNFFVLVDDLEPTAELLIQITATDECMYPPAPYLKIGELPQPGKEKGYNKLKRKRF